MVADRFRRLRWPWPASATRCRRTVRNAIGVQFQKLGADDWLGGVITERRVCNRLGLIVGWIMNGMAVRCV